MKIGILQTGHSPDDFREQLGDYGEMFTKLLDGHDFDFQIWSVVDGILPEGVDEADGWLITGSKHGAYEDHDWIPPLEDFIRETYADGSPMIGVCFGHQVIAQALGGKVEKFTGGWSIGRTEYDMDGDKLALNAWHQDQVVALPKGAKVVASSDFCPYAALAYDNRIWTVQPHPEFGHDFIDGLIKTRGKGVVPDHQLEQATAALGGPIDNQKIADQMAAFFKDNRKERA
ncbi:GMP synthase [glutamine-hydrolyzing] [Sulfitobacter sp. DSM 110093]|uniref:type 1 glutamine amidotransferase n=1 Tax=Sulfitobacter sp. DSM 110093 TaxID=2883127 RepID=UPI001FABD526|nr:type 1 glutamine amidotransferase [Sulfitobacter sp. DSM 110093]UOA31270.1 GMP synthase [glutamine-hydrolyzing] [Sulfitobacter sp. DSM 110093]